MPISEMTSSKATPQKAIKYILDKEKNAEWAVQNLDPFLNKGAQMMETARMWGKAQGEEDRKYYHLKIAFHPDDWVKNGGSLTVHGALEMCMRLIHDKFPGHEAVGAVHTDKDHLHFHGIINAVNMENGKMLDIRNAEYRRLKDLVNEMAAERGWSTINWRKATAKKRKREKQSDMPIEKTFAEQGIEDRGAEPWKDKLRAIIDGAVGSCNNMNDFIAALARQGVVLTRNTEAIISYKLGDHRACRGDSLGGDYTAQAIRSALKNNREQQWKENRDKYRAWGRVAGIKREEVDKLCDMASRATWAEKQAAWAAYKAARDAFWENYGERKRRLDESLDEAYRRRQKARDAEWAINLRNRRRSLGGIIFAAIVLKGTGPSSVIDQDIELLRMQQNQLRKEAKKFKASSSETLEVLRTKNLSLDTYMLSVQNLQIIAEAAYEREKEEYERILRELRRIQKGNNEYGLY